MSHRPGSVVKRATSRLGVAVPHLDELSAEGGSSAQLDKMLRILRALRLSDNLDQLIPEPSIRPIQLAGPKSDVRRRFYKRRSTAPENTGWVWGDRK